MSKTEDFRSQAHNRPVILMIIGGLGAGGKEQQLISLLKGIRNRGNFSVVMVVLNPNGSRANEVNELVDALFFINRLHPFAFFYPLFQIVQIARKVNVSIVHSWGSGIWDTLGLFVARLTKVPFLHGGIRSAPSSLNLNNRLSKWSAKHADAVVVNSKAGLQAFGQADNPKAQVIYNGLDLERFDGKEGITPSQYDLCMVGNFSDKKDHRTLINSMRIIIEAFPEARLLLVGHDAGTMTQIRMLVEELNLNDSVIFITDCLKPYQHIANSKICVLSTYGEGISNAILEYFVFSKPVIATDVPGNSEIIESGKNGYLVEAGSAEALAEKVISLLTNLDLAKTLGANGKAMVVEKFLVRSMITSYESTYLNLLEKPKGFR
jgi:glycosyltransferase involved in cell wall biosynthesis